MSFVMTTEERESFLAGVHVGVLAVAREGRGPLAVPVWYSYERGSDILIWMERDTVKDAAIRKAGVFSLWSRSPRRHRTSTSPRRAPSSRTTSRRRASRH
ncbi:hypothetical protein [Amycolatopsis palatopharyngis]|uniref:hypothetical protein n=1 Tax=Amycolatopsis palatopharyngis TaxID=187982 RepID=UPI003CCC61E0